MTFDFVMMLAGTTLLSLCIALFVEDAIKEIEMRLINAKKNRRRR